MGDKPRKKRKWLRRIVIAIVVLTIILGSVWGYWAYQCACAEAEIQAYLDECRKAGLPVDDDDFQATPMPDEENLAVIFTNAGKSIPTSRKQRNLLFQWRRRGVAEYLAVYQALIAANSKTFDILAKSEGCSGVDWGFQMPREREDNQMPGRLAMRLGRFLGVSAICHHAKGNDARAVESLHYSLSLADAVRQYPSTVTSHLAYAIEEMMCRAIQHIMADLNVGQSTRTEKSQPAPKAAVKRLIANLLVDQDIRRCYARTLHVERMWQLGMLRHFYENLDELSDAYRHTGFLQSSPKTWWTKLLALVGNERPSSGYLASLWFKPEQSRAMLKLMKRTDLHAEALSQPNWQLACAHVPEFSYSTPSGDDIKRRGISIMMSAYAVRPDDLRFVFRTIAQRRLTATALAVRLYEIDHGKRPAKLELLVPKYLPAVPDDPFAPVGTPLQYRPNAKHPMLYSLGPNTKDDAGAMRPKGKSWDDGPFDICVFLDGWDPREDIPLDPTTTQPAQQSGPSFTGMPPAPGSTPK